MTLAAEAPTAIPPYLARLNPEQREAVLAPRGEKQETRDPVFV